MGRIEDALAKLQARGKDARAASTAPARRIAQVTDAGPLPQHKYGGKRITMDLAALRQHGLLAPDLDMRRLADEYRVVKRPLLANAEAPREIASRLSNLIMVASALPKEGKTFTCVNLCLSIAREKDWSVVLVDTDCIKPQLTQLFAAEHEPGLLDLLKNPARDFDSVVMPTDLPGVSLLPAGKPDQQSSELLASRRMRDLCEQISSEDPHRIVLFDSSPLLLTVEAGILASQVGQIVVVVRANSTPQQAVVTALANVDRSKPVACVLNQYVPVFGVSGGYGGYYEYGNYGEQRDAGLGRQAGG